VVEQEKVVLRRDVEVLKRVIKRLLNRHCGGAIQIYRGAHEILAANSSHFLVSRVSQFSHS